MKRRDIVGLSLFCLLLFGYASLDGLSLSMHEARLPECSREMTSGGDWLVPRSGGRPWLERPPLPQWIEVTFSAILAQRCDRVWVTRLPAAVMGTVTVIATGWIASLWLGRKSGIAAGLILATSFEFYKYSTLAEDDVFLAALVAGAMACFATTQLQDRPGRVALAGFFVLSGLSNLCKGPLVGPMLIAISAGSFLIARGIFEKDWRPMRRFLSPIGWGIAIVLGFWWIAIIWKQFPDFRRNLLFDYSQTDQYDQPFWYYLRELPGRMVPWSPMALIGLWIAFKQRHRRFTQLVLCWAIFPVLLLSIPHRKHHHYLVPCLAPWAILAAASLRGIARQMFAGPAWSRRPRFGLLTFGAVGAAGLMLALRHIAQPPAITFGLIVVWLICVYGFYLGLWRRSGAWTLGSVIAGILVAFCWGQSFLPDENAADNVFLQRASAVATDAPLYINAAQHTRRDGVTLDFFRMQFYSRASARLLHNLTFLRDRTITAPVVYVMTRANDADKLATLGDAEAVLQSSHARQETHPSDRFTLFRLRFKTDLQRFDAPPPGQINTLQAMGREPGPWCGPPGF